MARSQGCSARRNGWRRMPRNFASTRSPTSIPMATAAAFSTWRARTRSKHFINDVCKDIQDPETKHDGVEARAAAWNCQHASAAQRARAARGVRTWPIDALGSGSDYTAFHRLCWAWRRSISAYGGEGGEHGVYHSVYDDFYWYTHFANTDFVYGRALGANRRHGRDAPGRRRAAALSVRRFSARRFEGTSMN